MSIYPNKVSIFCLGFAIGTIIALVVTVSRSRLERKGSNGYLASHYFVDDNFNYKKWLSTVVGYTRYHANFDYLHYSGNTSLGDVLENKLLKDNVNVLCVVFIKNVDNAYAAVDTWLKHCNNFRFYSMKAEKYIEVTVIQASNSWHYFCEVLRHLDRTYNEYMWVLFVPDDVFAIPDNLRYYVLGKDYLEPYYLGHRALFWNQNFNLAQAGFVLSKGSIKALINKFSSSESCKKSGKYWKNEDFYLGKYLTELGITPTDTRDQFGRLRFHLLTPAQLLAPGAVELPNKYWKTSLESITEGSQCCSPQSITFQGFNKDLINFYYYILYRLKIHTEPGKLGNIKSSNYVSSDQVWQQFVVDELGTKVNFTAITQDKYYSLWKDKVDSPSIFNIRLKTLFSKDVN